MMGRYEIWQHLWKMIVKKPVFGHGPYKEYFYDNMLYAENEFIFMAWRYGFVGLMYFLIISLSMVILSYKNRRLDWGMNILLILVVYGVTAMTNLPFSATTLNMLLGISIGIFYSEIRTNLHQNSLRN